MTGPPIARADELADLQANQQLLQQRIDQLAQAPGFITQPTPPGTPIGAGSFPRSFLIPGTDTSLRIAGFVQANVDYYLNGQETSGILFGQGGTTQTCPDGFGANCSIPSTPLDIHGQTIAGNAVGLAPGHSRGTDFNIDARLTQFSLDARTPTPWGEAKAYIEMDFAASAAGNSTLYSNLTGVANGWIPRIRKGYGTLGGLLVGQDNGSWRDTDSEGEFVTSGDEGYAGRARVPVIRYTWTNLPYGMRAWVAADNPDGEMVSPFGNVQSDTTTVPTAANCTTSGSPLASDALGTTSVGSIGPGAVLPITTACLGSTGEFNPLQNTMPDWIAGWRIDQPWGHLQLASALRQIQLNDGRYLNQNILGYGGYISGDVKPFFMWDGSPMQHDDIGWGIGAGPGIGSLISDCYAVSTNFGGGALDPTSNYTENRALYDKGVITKPVTCWGGHIDVLHWWTDQWRSNFTLGITHEDVNSILISGTNCITTGGSAVLNNCAAGGSASGNKELDLANVNLIWSPVTWVDLGVEYTFGHRQTVGNLKGDANVIGGKLKVKF